jgi:Zn-dependent protease with chaperone function
LSILIVVALAIAAGRAGPHTELLPRTLTIFLLVGPGWVGGLQSRIWWERRFNPAYALTPRPVRSAWISNLGIVGVLIVSVFVLIGLVPGRGGWAAWAILAAGALSIGVYLNWVWMHLMRAAGLVRPAGDRFVAIVSMIGDQMKVRPNSVVQMRLPMANAFAVFGHKSLGITDAALAVLSDQEIAAVCAHELGHLSEPRWAYAMRLINGFIVGALLAMPAALGVAGESTSPSPFFAVLVCVAICVAWLVCYSRLYRRMEVRADGLAKQFEPAPGVYAKALEKLYATNMAPVVAQERKHRYPELYDRMIDAGVAPEYPRPSPPGVWPLRLGMLVMIAGTAAGCYALDWLAFAITKR